MADSDDEYDRKRRDKFRGERSAGDNYRSDRRGDDRSRGRDDWQERGRGRPDYRDYRPPRDRYSPVRDAPPIKRMRGDWDDGRPRYGGHDGYGAYGGWAHDHFPPHGGHTFNHPPGGPMHNREQQNNSDLQTQPCMLTLKQFLASQDDAISDSDAIQKYNEYKLEFKRQQLNEFFVAHKDEEWFKIKYHPEESEKRRNEQLGYLKKRADVFHEVLDNGLVTNVTVDSSQTEQLLRLLDTVVIKLEGGTEEDIKILDEKPIEVKLLDSKNDDKIEIKDNTKKINLVDDDDDDVEITNGTDKPIIIDDKPEIVDLDDSEHEKKEPSTEKAEEKDDDGEIESESKKQERKKRKRSHSGSSSSSSSSSDSEDDEDKIKEDETKSNIVEDIENLKESENEEKKENDDELSKEMVEHENKENVDEEKMDVGKDDGNNEEENKDADMEGSDDGEEKDEKSEITKDVEESEAKEEGEEDNDKNETIDLDQEKDEKEIIETGPRALHKTSSIFLRNLAPTITKAEVEAMCKRFSGFLRVAIADPLVERRWFRRGWVTFKRDVNIKEICWNLNNIRLRDCELGAIVNRDLSRRVRPVNGVTSHKTIIRSDIKLCAKIAHILDDKAGLWKVNDNNSNANKQRTESFGLQSKNPVLQNITDYLIEEASAEEEELLGLSTGEHKENNDGETIERDPQLIGVLDKLILYLRIVHSLDFYNHCEYPYEDEMPNRCGIIHARGPQPQNKITSQELQDYMRNFENKMSSFLTKSASIDAEELKKLGSKDAEAEVEKFVAANTQELAKDKWLCPLSGKKFKGPEFIRKHIFNKHGEKVDEVRKEVEYFNNYLKDIKRPQLPEHPGNNKKGPPDVGPLPQGFGRQGGGGGGGGGLYPPANYPLPYNSYAIIPPIRPRGGGFGGNRRGQTSEYRPIIHYRDLDAPREPDDFI